MLIVLAALLVATAHAMDPSSQAIDPRAALKDHPELAASGVRAFGSVAAAERELRGATVLALSSRAKLTKLPSRSFRIATPRGDAEISPEFRSTYSRDIYWIRRYMARSLLDLRRARGSRSRPLTVVDIGANAGLWSVYAAKVHGANVISVEPNAPAAFFLRWNVLQNGVGARVTVREQAISPHAQDGRVLTFINDGTRNLQKGNVCGVPGEPPCDTYGGEDGTRKVTAVSLETIMASARKKFGATTVDLVKMNCEGAELAVIASVPRAVMRRIGFMTVELFDEHPDESVYLKGGMTENIRKTAVAMCTSEVWPVGRRHAVPPGICNFKALRSAWDPKAAAAAAAAAVAMRSRQQLQLSRGAAFGRKQGLPVALEDAAASVADSERND